MCSRILLRNDVVSKSQFFDIMRNISSSTKLSYSDTSEVKHFDQQSKNWWDEKGPVKALHALNQIRVPFIKECIQYGIKNQGFPQNFNDIKLLDVGCGGGILSEPLSNLGLQVTGIDMAENLIKVAKHHASNNTNLKHLNYYFANVEDFCEENKEHFDVVVASEIVEHVADVEHFLTKALHGLKPGGTAIITTINKTLLAKFYAISLLEGVKIIPRGTHSYEKFVSPETLKNILEKNSCRVVRKQGMWYNFLSEKWSLSDNSTVFYGLQAVKSSN
ncbi:ubiquinone biosynthesis O-methyltransferase, mitochondrial-like isoform X3 [Onthophagus taurus]|uniref:ubiquinone biosynthesis O-methyltransferase, mitochondrial-like isoform X3 n=1 Tax=Onthophagus taurus TaxID=166361 RepID=UPI0039BE32B9